MKIIFLVGMCLSINAYAIEWVNYYNNETTKSYIDIDSISDVGQYKKAWSKTYSDKGYVLNGGKVGNQAMMLTFVDCLNDATAIKAVMFYYNDDFVAKLPNIEKLEFSEVIPGTPGYESMKLICSH